MKMKQKKKNKGKVVERMFGMTFTTTEDLNKYKEPQYAPPKLKEVNERLSKGFIIRGEDSKPK